MGYIQRWESKTETFSKEFLDDVKALLVEEVEYLKDVRVNEEYICFNGIEGYGCETVVLEAGRSGSCKTGRFFSPAPYDKLVSSVLLLVLYHHKGQFLIHSDGVFTNSGTKEVSGNFEDSLMYLEEKFGYTFERELKKDEYEQQYVMFVPNQNQKKECVSFKNEILSKIEEIREVMNGQLESLQNESYASAVQVVKINFPAHAQRLYTYLQLLDEEK